MTYELGVHDLEIEDVDFSEGQLGLNWFEKKETSFSNNILENGDYLGSFDKTGAIFWNVYLYDKIYYVILSDVNDAFEVNKTILNRLNYKAPDKFMFSSHSSFFK